MAQIREIKKRIVAVGTIQRITKTMQMIATAKFTAAMQRSTATKPYTNQIRSVVAELAATATDLDHPLLSAPEPPVKRELLLVISSIRGLCGAYNANVLRRSIKHVRKLRDEGIELDLETSGKKAIGFFRFSRIPMTEQHPGGDKPVYDEVDAIASRYIAAFCDGKYDAVRVAYMRYESNARQIPEIIQLLPLSPEAVAGEGDDATATANFEFSPSPEALLEDLLPLAVKSQLFQAFNDASVSEQIMRMIAMKAATENAKDLGRTLHRNYNRARQAQITTELSEIIAGSAALE
ncbi:MAG: ATP synthase F1 subunit gamma [Planctomycetes bacterium]|nr:ATP synthase F1 subunit gamma [Planctomycetota bacterium]